MIKYFVNKIKKITFALPIYVGFINSKYKNI